MEMEGLSQLGTAWFSMRGAIFCIQGYSLSMEAEAFGCCRPRAFRLLNVTRSVRETRRYAQIERSYLARMANGPRIPDKALGLLVPLVAVVRHF